MSKPGEPVRLVSHCFAHDTGKPHDPPVMLCRVVGPGDALTLPDVVRDGQGTYHAVVVPQLAGHWRVRWSGMGARATSEPDAFDVED